MSTARMSKKFVLHPYYRDKYGYRPEDFRVAYREYQTMIRFPLRSGISDRDADYVIEAVTEVVENYTSGRKRLRAASKRTPQAPAGTRAGRILRSLLRGAFDRFCAFVGLIILIPVFAAIALAIKLDDGGPVFYSHFRVGKGFGSFRLLKFRTMISNPVSGSQVTEPEDPRITRVGHLLRRYKLDELPQLVNVLKGEMRLVGARPQLERYVKMFHREYGVLLEVPPGITDLASLCFRNENQMYREGSVEEQYIARIMPTKLQLSLKYHRVRTFFSDLNIIFRTVLGFNSPSMN
jgi:lipopolysaccharide/colanic/teichoic acid biosynthesis glycosyltransferase